MKLVYVHPSTFSLVDDGDIDLVKRYSWRVGSKGVYVQASSEGTTILMHRLVMGAKKGQQIDHKDGDTFNNQKSNLRFCTVRQQLANRVKLKNSHTHFKGVSAAYGGMWRARIRVENKRIQIGKFSTQEEAALAYNNYAQSLYGEFHLPNGERRVRT